MARTARQRSRSGIYHVMVRGINQQTIFEDSQDRYKYLETLAKFKEVSNYQLFGYCLMDNHVHLLIRERDEPISHAMKRISASYVYWYNKKYNRCGHLFQERFKSEKVEDRRYFLVALRYIHQNPMKAGLAQTVFESKWTSIHEYVSKPSLIDTNVAVSFFASDYSSGKNELLKFMAEENDDQCLENNGAVKLSDEEVKEYLVSIGVPSSSHLQKVSSKERDKILYKMRKVEGLSIRQLARVTGISRSVIQRKWSELGR